MKQITIIIFLLSSFTVPFAQNTLDETLVLIEKNNTTLKALRQQVESQKLGNKTDIYLQNPEVGFGIHQGNPSTNWNKTNISVSQSFDFPTAYARKRQISKHRNQQVDLEYEQQRREILLQARLVCIDLIYLNAFKTELKQRLKNATDIAKSYQTRYEKGDANVLEFNKSQLNRLAIFKEIELVDIEHAFLQSKLTVFNGGVLVDFNDSTFQIQEIPVDYEQWYAQIAENNPELRMLEQAVLISQQEERLNKALSLPKFQTGYIHEKIGDESLQGFNVGVSIPLWERKNSVKFAKAKTVAIQSAEESSKMHLYNELKALHSKVIRLQQNYNDFGQQLALYNSSSLLISALDKGEISLIEYIMELTIYYDSTNKILELQRDMTKANAELKSYM